MSAPRTQSARLFRPQAVNYVVGKALFSAHPAFHPDGEGFEPTLQTHELHSEAVEEVSNGVVHPVTKETINKYQKLIDDPLLRDVSEMALCI